MAGPSGAVCARLPVGHGDRGAPASSPPLTLRPLPEPDRLCPLSQNRSCAACPRRLGSPHPAPELIPEPSVRSPDGPPVPRPLCSPQAHSPSSGSSQKPENHADAVLFLTSQVRSVTTGCSFVSLRVSHTYTCLHSSNQYCSRRSPSLLARTTAMASWFTCL